MAVRSYGDEYEAVDTSYGETAAGGAAGKIFLWVAWSAAAIFWGFMLTTGAGILQAAGNPALQAGGDSGGMMLLIGVIAAIVVLAVIAWFSARWAGRNRRLDPVTEAATRAEYDLIEAHGGDDEVELSPEAHRPEERAAYRAIDRSAN